ncbi:MAG: class SAM-dependent methyltransferase [Nocardia sp.]|uniref:class I SAM-dependent methyltransferase n=1 Tax=Nocardia sp. TaxID=1821 RepID=UPI00263190C1|nr:class I SAM-dependent methyltransferase [Nocardia sp.]MCU1642017.1 class SAM-dependent methyltransferase [Nocardia sp.]
MTSDVAQQYSNASEDDRLSRSPHGRLEFLRTQELIRRVLTAPIRVLDVGGGTGVHAEWLANNGHIVHLIDPVPEHVEMAATLPGVIAELGDARQLPAPADSVDVVLLLGPMYHLTESEERATALNEAVRVLRPGGILIVAAISRYLSALETGTNGSLDVTLADAVREVIATSDYDGHVGFVRTHWHTADELRTEIEAAGLLDVDIYGIEGPAWPTLDHAGQHNFPSLVTAALHCARMLEQDPLLINASAHLLAIARTVH